MLCSIGLLLLLNSFSLFAQQAERKVDAAFTQASLKEVFVFLEKQTGYAINYFGDEVNTDIKVTVKVQQGTAREVLNAALSTTNYNYEVEGKTIIIHKKQAAPAQISTGKVSGQLLDTKSGDPVIGATIRVGAKGTTTDINGQYELTLAAGTHTLEISSIGYTAKKVTDVVIKAGQSAVLNLTLAPQKGTLKGVEVVASARKETVAALYVRQKNAESITDGISAEQIRATPDNNTAQVLKRVSGLTIQDDKFVTVRGLSERYNSVQLNRSNLPSTEPNRRNFAFDIIPSSLVGGIVVNKTATPDQPGEFAGAIVQVNTIDVPLENFLSLSAGTGYNTNSRGRDFVSTRRGDNDYWGFDDGRRGWWQRDWDRNAYASYYNAQNAAAMAEMNRKIPNNFGLYKYGYRPMQTYQLAGGRAWRLKNASSIGFVAGGTYRNEQVMEDFNRNLPTTYAHEGTIYNFVTTLGAVANVTYQAKGYKLSWKNTYTHRFNHETGVYTGVDEESLARVNDYYSQVLINDLVSTRLEGEHALLANKLKAEWFADYSRLKRDQPDTRSSRGQNALDDSTLSYPTYDLSDGYAPSKGLFLYSSRLNEERRNAGAALSWMINAFERTHKLKVGYQYTRRNADFASTGLRVRRYTGNNEVFDKHIYGKPDYVFMDTANLRPDLLYYAPAGPGALGSNAGDGYDGKQTLHAAYLLLDTRLMENLRLIGGVRMENNEMNVRGFFYAAGGGQDTTLIFKKTDWLPSANLIYSLNEKVNLRFAYSRTLARPDFRERQDFKYWDLREFTTFLGATGLKDTHTDNYDLRLEYYPTANEVVSVTGFHKKFTNPVELVADMAAENGGSFLWFNLDNSKNTGIEFDFRKSLGFLFPRAGFLQQLYVSGNFTWVKANVQYDVQRLIKEALGRPDDYDPSQPPTEVRDRPLQGTSPYMLNAGISYLGDWWGLNVTYNRFGKRIAIGGVKAELDRYENPRDVIDMQLSARLLKKRMEIKFNVSDLLHQRFVFYENRKGAKPVPPGAPAEDPKGLNYNSTYDIERFGSQRGTNLSLSASYRF